MDLFQRVLHNPIVYIHYEKVNTESKSEIMNEWRQYGQKNQGQEPEFWLSNVLDIVSQGVPSSLQKAILEKFVIFFFSLKTIKQPQRYVINTNLHSFEYHI